MRDHLEKCPSCGAAVGGADPCQQRFDALLARDFSDARHFVHHRLVVDTYCLQHPDAYCASFKSFAAHAMGVCWSLEHGGTRAVPSEAIRRWVERHPHLQKPQLPRDRGAITIADVVTEDSPAAYGAAVDRWAKAAWNAYATVQAQVRGWVADALAVGGRK